MRRIIYLPLESYEARYTKQLLDWNVDRFKEKEIPYILVEGTRLTDDEDINVGKVLDAHGRTYYSLTQIAKLVKLLQSGIITYTDVIFTEDMFAPGYEALPYIFEQLPVTHRPSYFTRCLAQSIDPDDFVFPWRNWMRHYEKLVSTTATGIMMANDAMGLHMEIAMVDDCPLYVTGLPFDKIEVRKRAGYVTSLRARKNQVIFSSRWDTEKQPDFYMDLIEACAEECPKIEFCICTGNKELRSNDRTYVQRAKKLEQEGKLKIYTGLKKNEYYMVLADSKVQFNCALQDWQSNTLNEASALGTQSLCPAYRSFPQALNNNSKYLYVPWSIADAKQKLLALLDNIEADDDVSYPADDQHETINRTIDILMGNGSKYLYKPYHYETPVKGAV